MVVKDGWQMANGGGGGGNGEYDDGRVVMRGVRSAGGRWGQSYSPYAVWRRRKNVNVVNVAVKVFHCCCCWCNVTIRPPSETKLKYNIIPVQRPAPDQILSVCRIDFHACTPTDVRVSISRKLW